MTAPIKENTAALNALLEEASALPEAGTGSAGAVLYTPQELTDEQKTQARSNIGALAETELGTAVEDALEQAKASGEFKGEKGDRGESGARGPTGEAGYTPVKGTDYWTEDDRKQMVNDVITALPNNGALALELDGLSNTSVSVPAGYTSGGTVSLTDDIEQLLAAI